MAEWFEDETFWVQFYPAMFSAERMTIAEAEVEQILMLTGLRSGAVLDLCCGPGRHAVGLAQRGFAVTGVDRTPPLLERARARAGERGVDVEWVTSDMRAFVRPAAFDLAINLFTSFGYFDAPEEDVQVLRNLHASLRPGGQCVIDVLGKERLAEIFEAASAETLPDGTVIVQRREIIDDWTRIRNEWIMIRDGVASSAMLYLRIYTGQELKDLLLRAGFASVRLYGDLAGNAYDRSARRLVAVAQKA